MVASVANRGSRIGLPPQLSTPRLVIRAWRSTDSPLLRNALAANAEHLAAFLPWAKGDASAAGAIERRIETFDRRFRADSEWSYALFSEGEKMLYGGATLARSTTKGALEIGFWLQRTWTKQGFATEAVNALVDTAFTLPNIERVEIRCDVRNTAAAGVARRAGFVHRETVKNDKREPGSPPRDSMVWERPRSPGTGASPAEAASGGFFGWLKSLFS